MSESERTPEELKEALEYQIDIVLRLEEERLQLLRENSLNKQKVEQLTIILKKYADQHLQKKTESIGVQAQFEISNVQFGNTKNQECQTDQIEFLENNNNNDNDTQTLNQEESENILDNDDSFLDNDSVFQYSRFSTHENAHNRQNTAQNQNNIFEQAQNLLAKPINPELNETTESIIQQSKKVSNKKPVKSNASNYLPKKRMPIKELSFKSKQTQDKENILDTDSISQIGDSQYTKKNLQKKSEQEIIAQEFVKLTRDQNQMRKEMRKLEELMKKKDKESLEQKRSIEVKNEMLDKLRNEVAELSLVLNDNSHKSIRVIEKELKKTKAGFEQARNENQFNKEEKERLQKELNQFRTVLEQLTSEYTKLQQKDDSKNLESQNQEYFNDIQDLNKKLKMKEEELYYKQSSLKEIKSEMEKLNDDIEYFKNLSQTSKSHSNKLLDDIEFYRNILVENNLMPN